MTTRVPRATYRLQLNAGFTFADAGRIAPYLAELGISDLYVSPILKSRRGSAHGYDIVDAASLDSDLGTDDDFAALDGILRHHGLGLLLDIVPNHMAASAENAWWMNVLENGSNSRFVHYFDIDWSPVTTRGQTVNKVLLPFLGEPYGDSLVSRQIQLGFDRGGLFFRYHDHRLPLSPQSYSRVLRECIELLPKEGVAIELRELVEGETSTPDSTFLKDTLWRIYEQDANFHQALESAIERFNGTGGEPETFDALDELLDRQWYRLAYWRIASHKINYRRFFDVDDLVGVRVENPEVFEDRNRRTLALIAQGKISGLRIDHIDGLYDPTGYIRKLQSRLADPAAANGGQLPANYYVILEKILSPGETLSPDFAVSGTTGYDFLDAVTAVFVDPAGLAQLDQFYRSFTGIDESFDDIGYRRKKQVIHELFSGEMRSLGKELSGLAMSDRNARDFAPPELTAALTEVTACLSVYRTYIREPRPTEVERRYIREAVARARGRAGASIDDRLFVFVELVLLVDPPPYLEAERDRWLSFVMRWQQFTGRVMAKGVEDTAFYIYNRLVSLNEVGGNPGRGGAFDPVAEFHSINAERRRHWPHTMNATSTHDTKRGEDVRARIDVLSEIPLPWSRCVRRWSDWNAHLRRDGVPGPNEELLLYQTLIGMWPFDAEELPALPDRLRLYLRKAAREAKMHTSWIAPDAAYEEALLGFAGSILENDRFRRDFLRFQKRIAFQGVINSLAQVVLKAAAPGLPDFYQGNELWDFSLVDPDNRRPVDYERRSAMLRKLMAASKRGALDPRLLLRRRADGRIKLFVIWKMLELRARRPELFADGHYEPVAGGKNICAFTRTVGGQSVLIAVPRLLASRIRTGAFPLGAIWGDASLAAGGSWRNIFTGDRIAGAALPLAQVFERFPVAVLERV